MKNLLALTLTVSLATALLAACASEPMSSAEADSRAACRRTDAPTGSNLVRKAECAPEVKKN
ncbi:MAG: hypothetical protein V4669_21830 [Pseudomonadota bacterium]